MRKPKSGRLILYTVIIIAGATILSASYLKAYAFDRVIRPGLFGYACLVLGLIFIITGTTAVIVERKKLHESNWILSLKINCFDVITAFILISSVFMTMGIFVKNTYLLTPPVKMEAKWAIGIYTATSSDPFHFMEDRTNNPVLTKEDVTDVKARFVADPFLIEKEYTCYLFFEVYNEDSKKGEIGVAVSKDCVKWKYERIILAETFHLSYPCVFKWDNEYYMIPEAGQSKSIRLYKADEFPFKWSLVKTLLKGREFKDNTIFHYNEKWWLFTETEDDDVLRLYYADIPLGPWTEHPKSPIIRGNKHYARPGGNVTVFDGRIVRYAQDCQPFYGNKVWAFEITTLTTTDYQEKLINKPAIDRQPSWNSDGMHQVSPIRTKSGKWIAAVDGNEATFR